MERKPQRARASGVYPDGAGRPGGRAGRFRRPSALPTGSGNGYHSGYKPGHMDTAEGGLKIYLPQFSDAHKPFHSKLFELLQGDSQMLEQLAMEIVSPRLVHL